MARYRGGFVELKAPVRLPLLSQEHRSLCMVFVPSLSEVAGTFIGRYWLETLCHLVSNFAPWWPVRGE